MLDANKMGYRTAALSSGDQKRQFAMELGAHDYIDGSKGNVNEQLQAMGGAALIMATAPNSAVVGPLTGGLQVGGRLLVLSVCGMVEVESLRLITHAISVTGYPSGHALDNEEAFAFTKLHNIKCMVEPFPPDEAQKVFEHMLSGAVRFRSVLVMNK
jgi:D-arabinose 1-dehydrogenase-like Zn-dependent alcohol dehydrogenase